MPLSLGLSLLEERLQPVEILLSATKSRIIQSPLITEPQRLIETRPIATVKKYTKAPLFVQKQRPVGSALFVENPHPPKNTESRQGRFIIDSETMANTYTQIYMQFVFAVQNKTSTIQPSWEDELYKYMSGFIQNRNHKLIAINGVKDHLHIFVGMHPNESPSNLMKELKGYSAKWINHNRLVPGRFQWQEGFGAFSYGRSQIDAVYHYVMKQKEHHRVKTFLEEYVEMLEKFDVEYDERYVFKAIE